MTAKRNFVRHATTQLLGRFGDPRGARRTGIRNAQELQVFGLRRSGNHAVIAWIAQQYSTPIVFLNNARPFHDPFTTYLMGRVPNAIPIRKLNPEQIERLRARPKNLLLLSYEDMDIGKLNKMELLPEWQAWVGNSGSRRRVLLLRDFYNWIASRVRLFENKGRAADILGLMERQIGLWLMYAREFVGDSRYLGSENVVSVRFDRWSDDHIYRLEILDRLGIPVLSNTRSVVPRAGGGSSFDGTQFSGTAEDMDLLNRWQYLGAPQYAPLLDLLSQRRPEIDQYNRRIFEMEYPFTILPPAAG